MRRRYSIAALGILALIVPAPAAAKAPTYKVTITFTQHRPWTYYYQQASPDCTRTTEGNGSGDLTLKGKGIYTVGGDGVTFSAAGVENLQGARTETVAGGECAASAVYPSTWSKVSEGEGTVTYAEPNTGCGAELSGPHFPAVEIFGRGLQLRWPGPTPIPPDFDPCPYFDGSNEAAEGHALPGSAPLDLQADFNSRALKKGARRVTGNGSAEVAEVETCANIQQECPEGVTYNASASVAAEAEFVFRRRDR